MKTVKEPASKKEKTLQKRKKEKLSYSKLISGIKKMNKEDIILLLSGIAQGEIKDFTGLNASLDVRIKAMDKLLPLIEETEVQEVPEAITIIIDDRSDKKRLDRLEKEIMNSGNGN